MKNSSTLASFPGSHGDWNFYNNGLTMTVYINLDCVHFALDLE